MADGVFMLLDADENARRFQVLNNLFATLVTVEAGIFSEAVSHRAVVVDNSDLLKIMAQTHFKIVWIMRGSDFNCARAKFPVNVRIGEQRYLAIDNRQNQSFADKIFVAFVVGVNSNARVA